MLIKTFDVTVLLDTTLREAAVARPSIHHEEKVVFDYVLKVLNFPLRTLLRIYPKEEDGNQSGLLMLLILLTVLLMTKHPDLFLLLYTSSTLPASPPSRNIRPSLSTTAHLMDSRASGPKLYRGAVRAGQSLIGK